MMSLTEQDLRTYLEADLGIESSGLSVESTLFSSGIIDSFSLVSLMGFLESRGGFRIDPSDVTLENLDSMQCILRYYHRVTATG